MTSVHSVTAAVSLVSMTENAHASHTAGEDGQLEREELQRDLCKIRLPEEKSAKVPAVGSAKSQLSVEYETVSDRDDNSVID